MSSAETVLGAVCLPSLTLPDGSVVKATRLFPLNEGEAFIVAFEASPVKMSALIRESKAVLLAMGFPEEALVAMGAKEVMKAAARFFTEFTIETMADINTQ